MMIRHLAFVVIQSWMADGTSEVPDSPQVTRQLSEEMVSCYDSELESNTTGHDRRYDDEHSQNSRPARRSRRHTGSTSETLSQDVRLANTEDDRVTASVTA